MNLEELLLVHYVKPDSMEKIYKGSLRSEYFTDQRLAEIFDFSLDYYLKSSFTLAPTQEIIEQKFATYFNSHTWPEEEYLIDYLLTELKDRYLKNRLKKNVLGSADIIDSDPESAVQQLLAGAMDIQKFATPRERISVYSQTFGQSLDDYITLLENNLYSTKGVDMGWDMLTDHMNGLAPGELAVMIGQIGVGKSWIMAKIACHAARHGHTVYYCSLENPKKLTMQRLDCIFADIPYTHYQNGTLNHRQLQSLKDAQEEIESLKDTLIIDTPLRKEERTLVDLYSRAVYHGADLMVGDQLSWVAPTNKFGAITNARTLEMSDVITEIADLSRENKLASVWAAQFNRQGYTNKKGERGQLQHIALSSTIEQIVDWAFAISQTPEQRQSEMLILDLLKARRAPLKTWVMRFEVADRTDIEIIKEYVDELAEL